MPYDAHTLASRGLLGCHLMASPPLCAIAQGREEVFLPLCTSTPGTREVFCLYACEHRARARVLFPPRRELAQGRGDVSQRARLHKADRCCFCPYAQHHRQSRVVSALVHISTGQGLSVSTLAHLHTCTPAQGKGGCSFPVHVNIGQGAVFLPMCTSAQEQHPCPVLTCRSVETPPLLPCADMHWGETAQPYPVLTRKEARTASVCPVLTADMR